MPTTPRGIWTPADSDDWDLTVDLAAMATSIDVAVGNAVTQAIAGAQPADTGWVNIASSFASGFSGTLVARFVGLTVEVRGSITTGSAASGGALTPVALGIPGQFRPSGNAWGPCYSSSYTGLSLINSAGNISIAQRTGTTFNGMQFSNTFLFG